MPDLLQVKLGDGTAQQVRLSVTPRKPRDCQKPLPRSFATQTLDLENRVARAGLAAESMARAAGVGVLFVDRERLPTRRVTRRISHDTLHHG